MVTMKNKKITKKPPQTHKKITVAFGYGLFALILLGTITSTIIPYTTLLMNPMVRHFNVAMFLVAFVAAAVLPALISYIIGDRATHKKNKLAHHYNGVLFGIGGYWLSMSLVSSYASLVYEPLRQQFPEYAVLIVNGLPIVALLIIMLVVALTYVSRQKKKDSVIEHLPYQLVLIGIFVAHFVSLLASIFSQPNEFAVWSLVYVFVFVAMIAISYKFVAKLHPTRLARLTAAIIAVSIAFIASVIAGQIVSFATYNVLTMLVPLGIGVVTWIGYLLLMARKA